VRSVSSPPGVADRDCGVSARVELLERAERTPSIVAADRLARALETTLSEMFAKWNGTIECFLRSTVRAFEART
jgi:hypothetical protein